MQETLETQIWSLGLEDALEEGMATHPSILALRIPMDREAWQARVHAVTKSRTQLKWLNMHRGSESVILWLLNSSFLFLLIQTKKQQVR